MSESTARDEALAQLKAARKAMLSATWKLSLEDKDTATKEQAAKEFLRVHHAIQDLENAQLADIRDALLKNESDLEAGCKSLAKSLTGLAKTRDVLTALSGFLSIVGRIIPLAL